MNAPASIDPTAAERAAIAERAASGKRERVARWMAAAGRGMPVAGRGMATLGAILLALVMALVTWDYYVSAPWTRDGRVRVQVASIAPQVSGQITELRVGDNQYVHEGDVLYVIDPFDFEVALRTAEAQLQQKAADLQVKQVQSERRQQLSNLSPPRRAADLCRHCGPGEGRLRCRRSTGGTGGDKSAPDRSPQPGQRLCHQPADAGR
jgi:multidrug efflux pump subunit AcrA (membrane-fusion protein)